MRDIWQKTLAYFGLADEDLYEDGYDDFDEDQFYNSKSPSAVRKITRTRDVNRSNDQSSTPLHSVSPPTSIAQARNSRDIVMIDPRSMNDAQKIGDRFKINKPVIIRLQSVDDVLGQRLVDFCCGLAYALRGNLQKIADKVFLLTPHNVKLTPEEGRRRLRESGFFFDKL